MLSIGKVTGTEDLGSSKDASDYRVLFPESSIYSASFGANTREELPSLDPIVELLSRASGTYAPAFAWHSRLLLEI